LLEAELDILSGFLHLKFSYVAFSSVSTVFRDKHVTGLHIRHHHKNWNSYFRSNREVRSSYIKVKSGLFYSWWLSAVCVQHLCFASFSLLGFDFA